jgi:hypothetical protein
MLIQERRKIMNKKLFISVPMKGRTEENIRASIKKMHNLAEIIFDQELDVIPSYIEDRPPVDSKDAIWYLGESIKKMAYADYFIGVDGYSEYYKGIYIERQVACEYNIPRYFTSVDHVAPDAKEIEIKEMALANAPKCCGEAVNCRY